MSRSEVIEPKPGASPPSAASVSLELDDHALFRRYVERRDIAAIDALVKRHGPVLLRVCRRVLGRDHDADDAVQATFLVLIRQADRLRIRESLGAWLMGTAWRIAMKARTAAACRSVRERRPGKAARRPAR